MPNNPAPLFRERVAFQAGYHVESCGTIRSPRGRALTGCNKSNSQPYIRINTGPVAGNVAIHRLVAYQKFGEAIYEPGMEVRHLNGNPSDYGFENIALGTKSQNAMDKTPEARMRAALTASKAAQRWDHEAILIRHSEGADYDTIMAEFGMTSKGAVSFIINKSIQSRQLAMLPPFEE